VYDLIKEDFRPFGGSLVNFIEFYKMLNGNLSSDIDVNQSLNSGFGGRSSFLLSFSSSSLFFPYDKKTEG
jgi:hypothetical protein